MIKRTNKECSDLQEKQIAAFLGGKTQPNSGGTKFGGGDVLTRFFFIEAKTQTTDKESFTIKKEWLEKAKEQAFAQRKSNNALAFRFGPDELDYYVIDSHLMRDLVHSVEANSVCRKIFSIRKFEEHRAEQGRTGALPEWAKMIDGREVINGHCDGFSVMEEWCDYV